mgnify:CR=1 FL=1
MGYPTDMDAVMAIARRHGLTVIEDVSHAHGGLYKGRKLGTIGDVAAFSCMSGKSFPIGEGGVLTTDNAGIYERALAFAHYERYDDAITDAELAPFRGLPLGGVKYRMHQMSSALGRVQLRSYDARVSGIQAAMNEFWDLLEGVPGIQAHRVDPASGSTMGGWYNPKGLYVAEELGGLSVTRFAAAIRAALESSPGVRRVIHLRTLHVGPDELLVAAKIAIAENDTGAQIARQIDEAEAALRAAVPTAVYVFLEPDLDRSVPGSAG